MEERKTILIVDDTETNIDILLELLGDQYDVMVALDGQSALDIAYEDELDLILLDIMMPNMDGYEVCERLKDNPRTKDIPVLFITARIDEDSIEKAYDAGGVDYITKPFKHRELLARVKTHLEIRGLINYLEFAASHDAMTGIFNRRKFFELAKERFKNSKENLYAIMIDIDKFKLVNDQYGHSIGDKVIKQTTKTITETMPKDSIFGRLGGEEFSIICNCDDKNDILADLENIRKEVEAVEVLSDEGLNIPFTISTGISKITDETKSIDTLLKEADFALYSAKGSGRNRVIFR